MCINKIVGVEDARGCRNRHRVGSPLTRNLDREEDISWSKEEADVSQKSRQGRQKQGVLSLGNSVV